MAGENLPRLADKFLPLGTQVPTLTTNWDVGLYTINSRNSVDVFNVKAYGAVGDGVTDDFTAITACIAAVTANGGGTVYFPKGNYLVNTTLNLDGKVGIVLRGEANENSGASATSRILWTATTTGPLSFRSSSGCGVESLFVQANAGGYSGTLIKASYTAGDTSFFKVERCNLSAPAASSGILLDLDHVQLTSVWRNNFSGGGIQIRGLSTAGSYSNNVRVFENQFIAQNTCAIQDPGQSWTIIGNNFETPTSVGASTGSAIHCTTTSNSTIVFSNWFGDAINNLTWIIWSGNNLVVRGNYIGGAATGTLAIKVNGPANQSIDISDNEFVNWATGVTFTHANTGIAITGNSFSSVTTIVTGHTISTNYVIERNVPGTSDGSKRLENNQMPNIELSQAVGTATAAMIKLGSTTATTVGAAGGASALPATPTGYWIINVAGTNFKVPYYAN